MVDTLGLGPSSCEGVGVQIPPGAPSIGDREMFQGLTWILLLRFCLETSCVTIAFPTQFWSAKECMYYSQEVAQGFQTTTGIYDAKMYPVCVLTDFLWNGKYSL